MKQSLRSSKWIACLLAVMAGVASVSSCQEDMKDYYEEPSWIKGSIYEILEDDGNYKTFLKGAEIAGWDVLLKGRAILTVMAPDDASMNSYLQEHYGTTDISQLPVSEVKKLIGFHVLYYNFDKQKLTNFRPNEGDGATDEEKNTNAGMYYKFRTYSQDPVVMDTAVSRVSNGTAIDTVNLNTINIFHYERFIPVFSYKMFQTQLIDAKYNYEYLFPDSEWKGDADGACFNVANAAMKQNDPDIAKNGTLFYVDRVLEPMVTIHDALEQNDDYQRFLSFYDEYQYWSVDEEAPGLYGDNSMTFYRSYNAYYPNIAREWTAYSVYSIAALASGGMSIFAPTNEAYDNFYKDYWGFEGTGWPLEVSWDTVMAESPDAIAYLMANSYYDDLAFPEQITNGDIKNVSDLTISFDVDAVPAKNRRFCLNGILYGLSELTPPAALGSVTGPTFQYRRFSTFSKMVSSDVLKSLGDVTEVKYIMFYPSNELLKNNSIAYTTIDGTTGVYRGTSSIRWSDQVAFSNAHIISLSSGEAVIPTDDAYHVYNTYTNQSGKHRLYIYSHGGRITNCYLFDKLLSMGDSVEVDESSLFSNIEELTFRGEPWSNGRCYEYDTENHKNLMEASSEGLFSSTYFTKIMSSHISTSGTLFQGFINVFKAANLIDSQDGSINFLTSTESYCMFVPTTEALKASILAGTFGCGPTNSEPFITVPEGTTADDPDFWDKISATEAGNAFPSEQSSLTKLQLYLQQYFLPDETYNYTNYPYVGFVSEGEVAGEPISSIVDQTSTPASNAYIYINDNGQKLSIQVGTMDGPTEASVDVIDKYHYLPFIFDDGCVHFINGVLDNVWAYENY